MHAAIIDLGPHLPLMYHTIHVGFKTLFYFVAPKGAVCFQTKKT